MSEAVAALPVARTMNWATKEEADRLGVGGQGTRKWAYRWIEEHVRSLQGIRTLADLGGGGLDSELCNRLCRCAEKVLVIDRLGTGGTKGNITQVLLDMEQKLDGLEDHAIDVVVSASAIEHLTAAGQVHIFSEIQRVLSPGGVFCGTVSYITRLTPGNAALIQGDPVFASIGSALFAPFDARRGLENAPLLKPMYEPLDWSLFPGFPGFEERRLLDNGGLVSDTIGSYGNVRVRPEVDALKLKWFELGLFLVRAPGPDSPRGTHTAAPLVQNNLRVQYDAAGSLEQLPPLSLRQRARAAWRMLTKGTFHSKYWHNSQDRRR